MNKILGAKYCYLVAIALPIILYLLMIVLQKYIDMEIAYIVSVLYTIYAISTIKKEDDLSIVKKILKFAIPIIITILLTSIVFLFLMSLE